MLLFYMTSPISIISIVLQSSVHIHLFFAFVSQCLLAASYAYGPAPDARLPPACLHLFRLLHYTNVFILFLVPIMYIIPRMYIYPVVDQI